MKNAIILFMCLLFSISTFGQTTGSMDGSLTGLEKYSGDGSVSVYGSPAIGSYNGYY